MASSSIKSSLRCCYECHLPIKDFCRDCKRYLAEKGNTEKNRNSVHRPSKSFAALDLIPNECQGVICIKCNTEFHNHCVMRRLEYPNLTRWPCPSLSVNGESLGVLRLQDTSRNCLLVSNSALE